MRALVLLGADPLDDFPDRQLAERALGVADFVVAVAGHLTESVSRADVVFPAAVAHERGGTTTNVEGRVSRLGQKLVPPGNAWPDWTMSVELAMALDADLGVTSIAQLWQEIGQWAPMFRGLTQDLIESDRFSDGAVVPLDGDALELARPAPNDPVANPGVQSVELQGAPPRIGLADVPFGDPGEAGRAVGPGHRARGPGAVGRSGRTAPAHPHRAGRRGGEGPRDAPQQLRAPPGGQPSALLGFAVATSPSLAPLVGEVVAAANPYDLDRLGLSTGDPVRVRSTPRASRCRPRPTRV